MPWLVARWLKGLGVERTGPAATAGTEVQEVSLGV